MKAEKVEVQNYHEQIGIEANPIIKWIFELKYCDHIQKSYQIFLINDLNETIYDSGDVISRLQNNIEIPIELETHRKYGLIVKITDENDFSEYSDKVFFVSGLNNKTKRVPDWITGKMDCPIIFGKSFYVDADIKEAYISICGLGQFSAMINGSKIGNHALDGPWTDYDKRILYTTFDISNNMTKGRNDLLLEVGNGWYIGKTSENRHFYTQNAGYKPFGKSLVGYIYLTLRMQNGISKIIKSDGTWWCEKSPTVLTNMYGSEDFDARLFKDFKDIFNVKHHQKVSISPYNEVVKGSFDSVIQPPVIVKDIYHAISIKKVQTKDNTYIFDLGQNMSGQLEIYVRGDKGAKLRITPVEKLNSKGEIESSTQTWCNYTLGGNPNGEVWRQKFTYFGARWIQIEGISICGTVTDMPLVSDVIGYFISSAVQDTGYFSCSDKRYNQILNLVEKAIESNLNFIHTDCPTIERLGWLEPNHLMGPSIMYSKDVNTLWSKISDDMKDSQYVNGEFDKDSGNNKLIYSEGLIPSIAPKYAYFLEDFGQGSFWDIIPWGSSILLAGQCQYEFYGNSRIIRDNYFAAKKYVDYMLEKYVQSERVLGENIRFINYGLGDWGVEEGRGESRENIETAFFYKDLCVLSKWAEMLSRKKDSLYYRKMSSEVLSLYNKLLLKEDNGDFYYQAYDSEQIKITQANQAIPLQFGMVPESKQQGVESSFLRSTDGGSLRSGEIGIRYIFNELSALNRNDIVEKMIMQKEHPSYYRFIEHGETTLPEFWSDTARSRNHDMMGQVVEWFYKSIGGISSIDGYKNVLIYPDLLSKMDEVNCTYKSVMGEIKIHVQKDSENTRINIVLPTNTDGLVRLDRLYVSDELFINGEPIQYNNDGVKIHGGQYEITFKS